MRVSWWPSSSSAARIAPIRPSIMSEGATTSVPAAAWERACRTSASTVASFSTWPEASINPSWPCVVYGSSATSVITPSSGTSFLSARTVRCTRPSGFHASRPSSLLVDGSGTGNSATAGMPSVPSRRASSTTRSIDRRSMPGIEATASRRPRPSITNSGWIRSSAARSVSRASRRENGSRRMRRRRVPGNLPVAFGPIRLLARFFLG